MVKPLTARLNVTFRLVMFMLTTLALFLGVISINSTINRDEPDSGLFAVEGDSFVHLTYHDPGFIQDQSLLKYLSAEQLQTGKLQVLSAIIGRGTLRDGTELLIRWSVEDFFSNRNVLLYRTTGPREERKEWDESFEHYSDLFAKLDKDLGIGGTLTVNYILDQGRSSSSISTGMFTVRPRSIPAELDYFIKLAAGFAFLVIGFVIYFTTASRRLPRSEQFFLICLSFFILFAFNYPDPDAPFLWTIFWFYKVALLFSPVLLLHFLYLMKTENLEKRWHRRLLLFYQPGFILLVLNFIAVMQHIMFEPVSLLGVKPPLGQNQIYGLICALESYYLPLMIIVILVLLYRAYSATPSLEQKKQYKWLFWGIGIGLLPFTLVSYPLASVGVQSQLITLAVSLPVFITPFSFALAVFSLRFLDVEIIFKRGFIYFVTSFSLLAIYLLLMFGLTNYSGEINTQTLVIISGGMILLATLVSGRIKDQVQLFFDRFLYRDFYNFRKTLQEFSVALSYERDLDRLLEKIVNKITETFSMELVFTFIRSAKRENFILAHSTIDDFPASYIGKEDSELLTEQLLRGKAIYTDQLGDIAIADVFREIEAVTFIPFLSLGEVIGFLALGNMKDGDILNTDDLSLLSSLADRAAASIDNAMLYLDLQTRAEEFRMLKEFSENIVESVDSGICALDTSGHVQSWNEALEKILGIKRETAIGMSFLDLLPERLANVMQPYIMSDTATGRFQNLYKVNVQLADGIEKVLNISLTPLGESESSAAKSFPTGATVVVEDSQREGRGTVVIVDDITDGVSMEEQLLQQEKLASLGLLAAGVAHEVNTPLTGIASYVQMMQQRIGDDEEMQRLLFKVETQSFRASRIINGLLSFSRQGTSERIGISLNMLILDSLSLLENQMKDPDVMIATDLFEDLSNIVGDRTKLQQVIINLLLNARDSMLNGGSITIKTWNENRLVKCSVADTGAGIAPEVLTKIFDPFFTTKEIGQGTGLGLSVSYGIIQEHKGDIEVESEIGSGTRFILSLPASTK